MEPEGSNCSQRCPRAVRISACETRSPRFCFNPRLMASCNESGMIPGTSLAGHAARERAHSTRAGDSLARSARIGHCLGLLKGFCCSTNQESGQQENAASFVSEFQGESLPFRNTMFRSSDAAMGDQAKPAHSEREHGSQTAEQRTLLSEPPF
jgi:hypothetical protein